MFNLTDDNLRQNIAEISIPVDADSHPDLNEEERNEKNENKFRLDCVQCRLFELKTLSNVIKVVKEFDKVKVKVANMIDQGDFAG